MVEVSLQSVIQIDNDSLDVLCNHSISVHDVKPPPAEPGQEGLASDTGTLLRMAPRKIGCQSFGTVQRRLHVRDDS